MRAYIPLYTNNLVSIESDNERAPFYFSGVRPGTSLAAFKNVDITRAAVVERVAVDSAGQFKILVVFVDGEGGVASPAFDDVATRGCSGFLVLSDPKESDLVALLGVQDEEGQIAYPKMPISFYSSSDSALQLAKSSGVQSVHKDSEETKTQIVSLLADPEIPKALAFVYIPLANESLSGDHWVTSLVSELAEQHQTNGSSKVFAPIVLGYAPKYGA